jgi:hypothetical protein
LQAGFDRFRHRVGDAELIKRARVRRVAGAGDDGDVGPQAPRSGDDLLVALR